VTQSSEHFKGCHPDDGEAPDKAEGHEPAQTEDCWHCATPTPRGCTCPTCWEDQDNIPPEAVYHCVLCGRYWAYMYLRVTTLAFPGRESD
jgi:hypothetical protein